MVVAQTLVQWSAYLMRWWSSVSGSRSQQTGRGLKRLDRGSMPYVSPVEAMRVFDMLYGCASYLMGGQRVVGNTGHAMRDAYERCLIDGTAPLFWLEMPLLGSPHSDLHVSYDFREVSDGARFASCDGFGYQRLLDWFAVNGRPGTGIDYTLDLDEDGVRAVGGYVSFHDASAVDLEGFCASIGRACDAGRCRKLVEAFPAGWRVWYASPFPGREGNPVRAAGLASRELQQAFVGDRSLVREHFSQIGLAPIPDELCARVSALAALPLDLELRIGMDERGSLCSRFDVSFYLSQGHMYASDRTRVFGENGAGRRALSWFEEWGIADDRWRAVVSGAFSKATSLQRDDGSTCQVALLCSPTCFMMPWRDGEPLAGKSYPKLQGRLMVSDDVRR